MKVKRNIALIVSLSALLAATGCKREAGGQVVAVVNGDEITTQEVEAEAGDAPYPQNIDKKLLQQKLLQRIIDRRLVAGAARADGIDKDQEYLLRQRQENDTLLAKLLSQRNERTFRIPDNAAIDKYVAAHPTVFAQRELYDVDRIQFPLPADTNVLRKLEQDHSMDAVAARLTSLNVGFRRDATTLDAGILPPGLVARIKSLPPTEPFVVPQLGGLAVFIITKTTPTPLTGADARPVAVQMMRREAVETALTQRLKSERAAAKIEYKAGFEPPKPGKS